MSAKVDTKHVFGAHMSISGGLHLAIESANDIGFDCVQVFVKNQRQWVAKPLAEEEVKTWKSAKKETGIELVVGHATYLINLASVDNTIWSKSVSALANELERCDMLEIPYLIFHPGSHKDASFEDGMAQVIKGIDEIHKRTKGIIPKLLLETTAGQGNSVGHQFEHLASIIEKVSDGDRLGVCVDTCHIFAAGYPLIKPSEYKATIQKLDDIIGIDRVKCIHINDSKKELGSHVDRHEHIGLGKIGAEGFKNILNDKSLLNIPKVLETQKGEDEKGRDWDEVNLKRLKKLSKQ